MLARAARSEVSTCIAGLKQYGERCFRFRPVPTSTPVRYTCIVSAQTNRTFFSGFVSYAGMAYEDAFDQAAELEQIYASALGASPTHPASFATPLATTARVGGVGGGGGSLPFTATTTAGDPGQAHAMAMSYMSPDVSSGLGSGSSISMR